MTDITLSHFGSGDNIGRNKIVIENYNNFVNEFAPENLQAPIKDVLRKITNRELSEARKKIEWIASLDNKNQSVKDILDLLIFKCELFENKKEKIDTSKLNSIITSSDNEMIKDLALSLAYKAEVKNYGTAIAVKRYEESGSIGPQSRAAVLELFNDKETLLIVFNGQLFKLTEEEIIGLINGLFRVSCFEQAFIVAEHLKRCHSNLNSDIVLLYAKSLKINESLAMTEYWYLDQDRKNTVINLIDEALELFTKVNNEDSRLFNILIPCLMYVKRSHEKLESICLANIKEVESFSTEFADDLKLKNGIEDLSATHPINQIKKSNEDVAFKKELINKLTNQSEISYSDFRLVKHLLPSDEFKSWVSLGVSIEGDYTKLGSNLNDLFIAIEVQDVQKVKELINDLERNKGSELLKLSSDFIYMLADMMQTINMSYESCDFLLACIGGINNIWCSPIAEFTLISLYNTKRYKDLLFLSEKINDQDKTETVDILIIYTHLYHNSPIEALRLVSKYRHKNSLDFMRLKLIVYKENNNYQLIETEVKGYDYTIFDKPLPIIRDIVTLLIRSNQASAYEKIVLSWFISSPEKYFKQISDASLNLLINDRNINFIPSYDILGISKGIRYSDGDKSLTKLIAKDCNFDNPYILNPGSNLFEAFKGAKVGDEIKQGFKIFKVEEILPPYVAVHRIANAIREEFNDGTDGFQSFSVSSNPEEMMEQLKQFFLSHKSGEDERQALISDDVAPLSLKMALVNKSDPVKSALYLLTINKSNLKGFIDFGEEDVSSVCTDIITILYICLTSLSKYFVDKNIRLSMIQEDIDCLQKWLDVVDADKFMEMGGSDSGDVYINTSETVRRNFGVLLYNLKSVIKYITPLGMVVDNYSKEVNDISDLFGPYFAKQLYAFKNCGYPFLSIDSQVCFLNKSLIPLEFVNTSKLFYQARAYVPYHYREAGLLIHVHGPVPYPLTIEEFTHLSFSNRDVHGVHLSSLINKYSGSFNKNIKVNYLMASMVANFYDKSVITWDVYDLISYNNPCGPKIDNIFNSACKAVVLEGNNKDQEFKVGIFIAILLTYGLANKQFCMLINTLGYEFCCGHFMDLERVKLVAINFLSLNVNRKTT